MDVAGYSASRAGHGGHPDMNEETIENERPATVRNKEDGGWMDGGG